MSDAITPKTWEEFKATKLLWWINHTLHLFGWAIVLEVEEGGTVNAAYPARVKFRGFTEDSEERGFIELTEYIRSIADELIGEVKE